MLLLLLIFSVLLSYTTAEMGRTGVSLTSIIGIRSYYDKGDNTALVTWEYYPDNADIIWIRCYYAKYAYKVREKHVFTLRRDPEEGLYFRSLKDRGRYRLEDGIFKLLIDRPNILDEGIYDCEFKPIGNKPPVGNKTELARSARLVDVRGSESSFLHGDRYGKVHFTLMPSNASINWARCFKMKSWYTGEEEHVYTYRYVSGEGMSLGRLIHRSSHQVNLKRGTFIMIIKMPIPADVGEYKCEFASVMAMSDLRYAVSTLRRHVPLRGITTISQAFESGDRLAKLEWTYLPSDATMYHVQCFHLWEETQNGNEWQERVYAYDFRSHEETLYVKWKTIHTSTEVKGRFRITISWPKRYHAGVYRCGFQGAGNTHRMAALRLVLIKRIKSLESVQEKTFHDDAPGVSLSWKYQPEDATVFDINCLHKKYLYKGGSGGKVCTYNYFSKLFETFELWKDLLRYKIGSGRFELTIINPKPRHEGMYECEFYSSKVGSHAAIVKLIRDKSYDHTEKEVKTTALPAMEKLIREKEVKTTALPNKGYRSFASSFVQILCMFRSCMT